MYITSVSNISYKGKNQYHNQREKLTVRDFADFALPVGILCNFNYFTDFKSGTKCEKFGKGAILASLILSACSVWFASKRKTKEV